MTPTDSHARSFSEIADDCVHCGFCLPACPTYRSWGAEADSPRGRIDLMKGLESEEIELTDTIVAHFDRCLGCMACVTACPSGVRYDLLIEETRARVEERYQRPAEDSAFRAFVFALFPYPERLRTMTLPLYAYAKSGLQRLVRASGITKLLPARLAQLERMSPEPVLEDLREPLPPFTAARGTRRGSVLVIAGCVQRAFFPNVNAATVRVLSAEGYDVSVPAGQGCCGALSLHAGRDGEAKAFAEKLVRSFGSLDGVDAVIINAAGCGSTLKQYAELLETPEARRFAAKVLDINEFLASVGLVAERRPFPLRVAYHDACHLAHAQRIREQPRALLRAIPGLELVEIPDGDQCCGSAGVYNLFEPESAAEIGERKASNVARVAPQLLASANPGCTLQIVSHLQKRGITIPAAHPIEILDATLV
jgi:glycolate oxidase iron-sulfur subunit